ncbi:HDOD domain-containing protein [Propionivibrio sp.]|uniref:HDOD domain-containing protein n=1 Tax=Propionivibrio sp. TaxID=2212460 RepID=UPI0025FCACF7|nr:HDOD domain-containing protein [Propionivibrio sp.]
MSSEIGEQDASMRLDRDAVLKGVRNLPSLPAVVIELLQSMDNDDADTRQLATKLAHDQALAAKVLRVANSSFYGLQGKVDSIGDAIVVLGLHGLRTLAIAAAVTDVFASKDKQGGYDLLTFWRHSVAVGLCAREVARQRRMNEGNAFAAGLMHDIGRLALASCFPGHLTAVAQERIATGDCWLFAERRVLGLDHAEIGRLLTEHWRFPSLLSLAIGTHHAPDIQHEPLATLINVADALGHRLDRSEEDGVLVPEPPLNEAAWAAVGLTEESAQSLVAVVEAQFESACAALIS